MRFWGVRVVEVLSDFRVIARDLSLGVVVRSESQLRKLQGAFKPCAKPSKPMGHPR